MCQRRHGLLRSYRARFPWPVYRGHDVAFGTPSIADSETSISYEAGIKSEPWGAASSTQRRSTTQYPTCAAVGGGGNLVQLINADEGVGYGFEVDSEFLINDNLVVRRLRLERDQAGGRRWNGLCAMYGHKPDVDNDGFAEVDGNPFPQAPDFILSFSARYSVPAETPGGEWFMTDWIPRVTPTSSSMSPKSSTLPAISRAAPSASPA